MPTIYIIFTLFLLSALLTIVFHAVRIINRVRHLHFFIDHTAGCCESLAFTGCSVICHSVSDINQLENLLQTEYDRYEVIAVIDSRLYADIFYLIVEHYALIRVNTIVSSELPDSHIRALYRSKQRCFRRLVLLDAACINPYKALNCATAVASYEYIIPLGPTMRLRPSAIESIALLISELSGGDYDAIRCVTDSKCTIFKRETIIRHNGFSADIIKEIPARRIIHSTTPAVYSIDRSANLMTALIISLLLVTITVIATIFSVWLLIPAALLTLLLIGLILELCARLIDRQNCSVWSMLCYIRNFIFIFHQRKFLV